jgi:hypothetical protein
MVLPLVQQDGSNIGTAGWYYTIDTGTVGISSEGKSAAADWMIMILYDKIAIHKVAWE